MEAPSFIFARQATWPIYTKIKVDTLLATNTMISIDVIVGALGALLGFRLKIKLPNPLSSGSGSFAFIVGCPT
ncbi:hypothetical protein [Paenibacillus agricola]|uniref:Uncharacterized protein n=1 Tax=Paenibacillus agricola TaxID=2716264 RepID=A0ABX0J637_9BACL|nr:hypothetical protein [Paenibacillus agricola]NHN31403.1 hypothetical protein [Paenibacillus agricola]